LKILPIDLRGAVLIDYTHVRGLLAQFGYVMDFPPTGAALACIYGYPLSCGFSITAPKFTWMDAKVAGSLSFVDANNDLQTKLGFSLVFGSN
jgi:hypothetical protein